MVFLNTPGSHDLVTLNEDPKEARLAGANVGIAHFGFRLVDPSDLDRAISTIEEHGGRLIRRGEHQPGQAFAYVEDPDGYLIEL